MKKRALGLLFTVFCLAGQMFGAPKYISPNNDGVQDELVIPLHISDKRYIKTWSLVIMDSKGNVIRTIENKVALPESLNVKSIMKQIVTPKEGVSIPESITWNGAMNNGETAPDGTYNYYVTATDDNGNVGKTKEYQVVVDTKAPVINLTQPTDKTFGEGSKSSIKIQQSGSKEDEWVATFKTVDGKVVKTYKWANGEPAVINWNGTNDDGEQVPDGIYTYEITSKDRAGNVSERAAITNIIYSADKPATNIYISGSKYFAPGTEDGIQKLNLNMRIPVPNVKTGNKLVEWAVIITDSKKKVVRTYNNTAMGITPPEEIEFDGKDDEGNLLPDGNYQAAVTAKYLNGYVPTKISSPVFVIDTVKPEVSVRTVNKVFGGKNLPEVKFNVTATPNAGSPESKWKAEIKSVETGKTVRTYDYDTYIPQTISWNGLNDSGKIADKGEYKLEISAKDAAGNIGGGNAEDIITFDTTEAAILLAANYDAFSPNADRIRDTVTYTPVTETKDVINYNFIIKNAANETVYTKSEKKRLPATFVWDGKDSEGIRCSDGKYVASLEIETANGSNASASSVAVELDTQFPSLKAEIPYTYISPDGDGNQDTLPITISECTNENKWVAEVRNAKDKIVKTYTWSGTKDSLVWEGDDESGNPVEYGKYSILIHASDDAGNSFSKEIKNIVMDNRETKIYLTAEYEGISPNNDKYLDVQEFEIKATVTEDISTWKFEIKREDGTVVYALSNADTPNLPAKITWNGADKDLNVCEGTFFATVDVSYLKGNKVNAVSTPFICTANAPALSVQTAPQYFSPDNDGIDDDLFIKLSATTKAQIKSWSFVIEDPKGKKFWTTEGKEQLTERLIWDGLSNIQKDSGGNAERVQSAMDYPYTFTVTDNLGMKSVVKGVIPIDVLVIREGNVLKMAVPSIIFESDAANFQKANSKLSKAQVSKNLEILNRIADILKKFPDYKISIQGHANRISDNEDEETIDNLNVWGRALMPLSKERADGIKAYLEKRGVSGSNISTEGMGGTRPVVDPKDKDNNWKNRRVEFILVK
ncbi:MAG: OmpA family protein [Treponema sp.]|nr:OmpA family protein [Treponema sp.]